jgi:hypothetical protein
MPVLGALVLKYVGRHRNSAHLEKTPDASFSDGMDALWTVGFGKMLNLRLS